MNKELQSQMTASIGANLHDWIKEKLTGYISEGSISGDPDKILELLIETYFKGVEDASEFWTVAVQDNVREIRSENAKLKCRNCGKWMSECHCFVGNPSAPFGCGAPDDPEKGGRT